MVRRAQLRCEWKSDIHGRAVDAGGSPAHMGERLMKPPPQGWVVLIGEDLADRILYETKKEAEGAAQDLMELEPRKDYRVVSAVLWPARVQEGR